MEDTFPVIDAEKINCEEGECKKLREACERWGCFMADMKKVVEALVVTWDKMHSALYMRPWVSMTCVPHKLCRFSVLNLMTRSTRVNIGQKMAESLGLVVADFEDCDERFWLISANPSFPRDLQCKEGSKRLSIATFMLRQQANWWTMITHVCIKLLIMKIIRKLRVSNKGMPTNEALELFRLA
ncbi:hypothetical protein JHK82_030469 [Glycine max]|nr:hypothetical protein JHK85_031106 [Glycine max]KAG4993739.1 hypothetical protein JHK86_030566 [Glycine max]KAG5123732.1 hypothetical protein JHK82_030469 [Glycine max]KAH1224186.1 hypothetical protein GmHk_11G031456 [Glycine max]